MSGIDEFDDEAIAALDGYCDRLRKDLGPDKASLIDRYPAIAGMLDCLDALQRLSLTASFHGDGGCPEEQGAKTLPSPASPTSIGASPGAGTPFGNYELLELLGRGGMGVVYKARQKGLERLVALKMLLSWRFASAEELRRFQGEACAAARLRHPHVLQVHEAGCIDGQHYFAMQYVDGPSLARILSERRLTFEEAAVYLLKVARAVSYLHDHGIVHRDLKPANILLERNSEPAVDGAVGGVASSFFPYVTDFGLVKMLERGSDLTSTGAIMGTANYMAPEQAAGHNSQVGPLSDVYSLGAILYESLTGRPPFREATPLETLVQVIEGEVASPREINPAVPRDLELICLKALSKRPELRYGSASDLADDLERYLRKEPIRARPKGIRVALARWIRQESALAARLLALGAAGMIAEVYYQIRRQVELPAHLGIMGILALWALTSFACQWILRQGINVTAVRRLWLFTDVLMLTAILILDRAYSGALTVGYAVLIVGSGLWFRVLLVWWTTALSCLGYVVLIFFEAIATGPGPSPQHHLIVLAGLAVTGWMVAIQVERVRALSRYYENRPMI
jgi:serine/threonine-protein kinase